METSSTSTASGFSRFYILIGKLAGWASAFAFTWAFVNKITNSQWPFSPSDFFQAALYLVLFAIFASMAAISSK